MSETIQVPEPVADLPAFLSSVRSQIMEAVGEITHPAQYLLVDAAVNAKVMEEIQRAVLMSTPDRNAPQAVYLHDLYLKYAKMRRTTYKDLGILNPKSEAKKVPDLRDRFAKKEEPAVGDQQQHPLEPKVTCTVLSKLIGKIPDLKKTTKDKGAKFRRERLIEEMGGKCARLGEGRCHGSLEFDHPNGRNWKPEDLGAAERIAHYEADWRAGLLRLLCRSHNASDGAKNKQGKARWKKK